ncbi:hypothetical protein BTM36_23995 [Herbaspirillum sp. VT-16-41]|nr:hypothetical protein BTM36_23995 [Herbaspirillum sp. VT-16-41]
MVFLYISSKYISNQTAFLIITSFPLVCSCVTRRLLAPRSAPVPYAARFRSTGVRTHGLGEPTGGIVGLSRAGREYARMLRGLGVDCLLAFDPYVSHEEAASLGVVLTDLRSEEHV